MEFLEKVSIVRGNLHIWWNNSLKNLEGLSSLVELGGNLVIGGVLENLQGIGPLEYIGGNLEIMGDGPRDLSGLENLKQVEGFVGFYDSTTLLSLNGLGALRTIGKGLGLKDLQNLQSLSDLKSLISIGGGLEITNSDSLTSLQGLENITYLGEELFIEDNDALETIKELGNLTFVGGDFNWSIMIQDNPMLPTCEANWLVETIGEENIVGEVAISRNNDDLTCD